MARQLRWLSDTEWAKIEPLLTQGRKGARRVDDRRVISDIIHMLKIGARWRGTRTLHNDLQPFPPLERARRLVRRLRGVDRI